MSLDWNLTGESHKTADREWVKAVVFECMHVGLNGITASNLEEFKMRSDFVRKLHVVSAWNEEGETLIPLDVLRGFIGLRTNVSNETWAKFTKRHVEAFKRDTLYRLRQQAKREEKAAAEVASK